MDEDRYPIFCGTVIKVLSILEDKNESGTFLQYLPPQRDNPILEIAVEVICEKIDASVLECLEDKIKTVFIPIRLDPLLLEGADIRTCFGKKNERDYLEKSCKTYELEIIKGSNRHMTEFHEHAGSTPFTGLKYIKVLS